jgi:hypothetical protein
MTGTSMSGPITAAKAAPLSIPNVATVTAIASSKLLEAAVNDSVAHLLADDQHHLAFTIEHALPTIHE